METDNRILSTALYLPAVLAEPDSEDGFLKWLLDPPQADGEIGRLDGWPVGRFLGRGGMSVVVQGRDEKLSRDVAIKVLRPDLALDPAAQKRFAREARLTANLRHERIVTVYSVVDRVSPPYLVMELLEGGTLRDRLNAAGPLPVEEIAQLAQDLAEGLAAAHQVGLLHRDLKPTNVGFRADNRRAVLMDFGLARAVCETDPVTELGSSPGTPAYMSPEQAGGRTLDTRSDLFSLGGVLYTAATGRMPFSGDTPLSTCYAVIHEQPPDVQSLRPELPDDLANVIRRLMAKSPWDRYQSAAEVAAAVRQRDPVSPPHTSRPARRVAAALAAVAILLGVVLVIRKNGEAVATVPVGDGETVSISVDGEGAAVSQSSAGPLRSWKLPTVARTASYAEHADGSVTLTNPSAEYNWVMIHSLGRVSRAKDRYLVLTVDEVGGADDAGWYLKIAGDHFGAPEFDLANGRKAGTYAVAIPNPVLESHQARWAVQVFATGGKGSTVRFRDVRFTDQIPEGAEPARVTPAKAR